MHQSLRTLSPQSAGQCKVLGLDGDPLSMDGGKIRVFEQRYKICLGGFLQRHDSRRLEPQIGLQSSMATMRQCSQTERGELTLKSCAISRTSRWKGSLRMRSSVDFWYRLISRRATVPGRNRCGFFTPPVVACRRVTAKGQSSVTAEGENKSQLTAVLRAADDLAASCLRGALPERNIMSLHPSLRAEPATLPPVDLRAVCLVRAMR